VGIRDYISSEQGKENMMRDSFLSSSPPLSPVLHFACVNGDGEDNHLPSHNRGGVTPGKGFF
jgi:hypothetical protein